MRGFEIYYNFINKHQAIGKCPYELSTELELKEKKWLELTRLSKFPIFVTILKILKIECFINMSFL